MIKGFVTLKAGSVVKPVGCDAPTRTLLFDYHINQSYVHHVFDGEIRQVTFDNPPNFAKGTFDGVSVPLVAMEAANKNHTHFGFATPVFYVADLIAARNFYRDTLGFAVDTCWPDDSDPQVLIVDHGDAHLMFAREDDAENRSRRAEVRIETSGVTALHKKLAPKATVEWGPEVYFYGRREFSVRDPNGVSVIFSEEAG